MFDISKITPVRRTCAISRYASVFVGFCSVFASHGAAFTQGESNFPPFPENGVVFITQNGTYTRKTLSNVTLMQQSATAVPTGVLLLRHDGKLYMVPDHRMNDGRMVSEMVMRPPFPENGVVFITQNGTYTRQTLSNVEVDTLMQQSATAVPTGVLLLRHDGKLYMVPDHRMNDGRMVSEMVMRPAAK